MNQPIPRSPEREATEFDPPGQQEGTYQAPPEPPPEPEPDDELNREPDDQDDDPPREPDPDPEPSGKDDDEAKARLMGWVPKNEWRGKPDDWRPAKEFLERAYANRKLFEDRFDKVAKQNEELLARTDEMGQVLKELSDRNLEADQRGYERALADLEEKRRQAVEEADTSAFQEADDGIRELQEKGPPKKAEPAKPAEPKAELAPEIKAEVDRFRRENSSWYEKDLEMSALADGIHARLLREEPNLPLRENLDRVAAEVRRRYPERFENPRRRGPSPVHGATGDRGGRKTGEPGRTYADLPKDAQAMCDKFVRTIPGFTVAEYLKTYPWSAQ